jgi:hypothetical protein
MDRRIAQSSQGAMNSSEQSHRVLTFFLSLRIRGCVTVDISYALAGVSQVKDK